MPRSQYAGYRCVKNDVTVYVDEDEKDKYLSQGYSCTPRRWNRQVKTALFQQAMIYARNDKYISNIYRALIKRVRTKHPDFSDGLVEAYARKDLANLLANWVYITSLEMMGRKNVGGKYTFIGYPPNHPLTTPYIKAVKQEVEKTGRLISFKPAFPIPMEELKTMKVFEMGIPMKNNGTYVNPITGEVVFS